MPGVGVAGRTSVEMSLEDLGQQRQLLFGRARHTGRRHQPSPELSHQTLGELGVVSGPGDIERRQGHVTLPRPIVMTPKARLLDDGPSRVNITAGLGVLVLDTILTNWPSLGRLGANNRPSTPGCPKTEQQSHDHT
jgi:hypothetical protein